MNDFQFHSSFMLILKLSRKRYKVVDQITTDRTQKLIKFMKTVVMVIKSSAITMMNTKNQRGCIGVRMLFINSWKKCYMT